MRTIASQSKNEQFFFSKKTGENRQLFAIPKPILIPTENRHLSKKMIPTDVKKSIPLGSTLSRNHIDCSNRNGRQIRKNGRNLQCTRNGTLLQSEHLFSFSKHLRSAGARS
jgi:hypothetical protein